MIVVKTIGTSFTKTAQKSMSIDYKIEASLKASFFKYFETQIGVSTSTKYDWTHISSRAKNEEQTFSLSMSVPPRKKVSLSLKVFLYFTEQSKRTQEKQFKNLY